MSRRPAQKTFSFGPLLAGVLLLLLAVSMSLIAIISSYFTRRSVTDLSQRIVQQTLARVELRIDALLAQAVNQNAQLLRLLEAGQLSAADFHQLSGYLAHSLEVFDELTYLGFGREDNGDYIFAERLPHGPVRVREYVVDDSKQRVIRDWRWSGADCELLKTAPWDGYDPRQRPFYQRARFSNTNVWTETYQFWRGSERGAVPGVTYAAPVHDRAGRLVGVVNADFDLAALCHFLDEVKHEIPGYAFVVERRADGSKRLIAHPDPSMLTNATPDNLASVRDPVVATFIQTVLSEDPQFKRILSGSIFSFRAKQKDYFGSARRFEHPGDPPWAIALIIPTDDVMAAVYHNDRWAFWIGITSLALTAWIAVRIARRIAEPLRALTREAQSIGRLELHAPTDTTSRVEELARLAHSMAEMKTSLRSFQKFVPADVVRELVTSAREARLGGGQATLTLFFSDIANFTAIAERMTPEALVAHVGEYLGGMSDVILTRGGTVDKFIGDGIMAFWGAPRPNLQHAADACRAALHCQEVLQKLCERWREADKPLMRARIGLHTGSVVVGNIGSEQRLNYTAIGDSVNLTSRLEGLNKYYGTEILISAACAEAAGSTILTRPVDNVTVLGRHEGIVVHELLGLTKGPAPEAERLAELTRHAFAAYLQGDFGVARERYLALLQWRSGDPVAELMEKRCAEFIAEPRPSEWDTTFRMREK